MAHPGGRPKIKTSDFMEDWQTIVLEQMSAGASRQEVYGLLDISEKTFARLMADDTEFYRTIKRGERLSMAWWERVGREHLQDKTFNYVGWYMNMKNRFNWKDKNDFTSNGETISFTNQVPRPVEKKQ